MATTANLGPNTASAAARRTVKLLVGLVAFFFLTGGAASSQAEPIGATARPALSQASAGWQSATAAQYDQRVHGRTVYDYIAWRAAHRKPGERLTIVSGVDHVAVYDGQVRPTYRLLKGAKSLGYRVYFVSGSSTPRSRRLLNDAGYAGLYDRVRHCGGDFETMSRCKAAYRSRIVGRGYALVVNVGAHEQAWKYGPQGERTVKLRY